MVTEYSVAAVDAVEAQLRELTAESAALKRQIEAIREQRRDVIRRMEPLLAERARLYAQRESRPGDVIVGGGA